MVRRVARGGQWGARELSATGRARVRRPFTFSGLHPCTHSLLALSTNYKITFQSTNARFEVPLLWIIVVLPSHLRQLALPFLFLRAICLGQPIFKLYAEAAIEAHHFTADI